MWFRSEVRDVTMQLCVIATSAFGSVIERIIYIYIRIFIYIWKIVINGNRANSATLGEGLADVFALRLGHTQPTSDEIRQIIINKAKRYIAIIWCFTRTV